MHILYENENPGITCHTANRKVHLGHTNICVDYQSSACVWYLSGLQNILLYDTFSDFTDTDL